MWRMQLWVWRQISLEFGPFCSVRCIPNSFKLRIKQLNELEIFFSESFSLGNVQKSRMIFLKLKSLLCSARVAGFLNLLKRFSVNFNFWERVFQIFGFSFLEAITKEVTLEIYNSETWGLQWERKGSMKASITLMQFLTELENKLMYLTIISRDN